MRSLLFAFMTLIAAPAAATEWVHCGDAAGEVSVGLLLGGVDFIEISAVTLTAGEAEWASAEVYGAGTPIGVAQAYMGEDQIVVDLTDDNYNDLLAELRVYLAEEGEDYVQGGILRVPGHGAWVVTCEGP